MVSECYDVIIIGTNGGRLAYRLSLSAKRILRRSRVRNQLAITATGIGLDQLGTVLNARNECAEAGVIGGAISLSTANQNGLAARADHSNSVRCSSI
jgi:hypothetical protein